MTPVLGREGQGWDGSRCLFPGAASVVDVSPDVFARKSSKMQQGKLDSKLHLGKLNLNAIETYAESFVGRSMEYRRKDSGEVSAGSQTRSNKDLEVGSPQDQALQSEDTRRRTRSWSDDAHDLAKATALPLVANYQEVAARVAALHHPNIVAVMGLTTAPDNSVCLVTERFQKPPLSELLQVRSFDQPAPPFPPPNSPQKRIKSRPPPWHVTFARLVALPVSLFTLA